jgi:hypothetical protein
MLRLGLFAGRSLARGALAACSARKIDRVQEPETPASRGLRADWGDGLLIRRSQVRALVGEPIYTRLSGDRRLTWVIFLGPLGNIFAGLEGYLLSAACCWTIGREVGATRSGRRALM